MPPISDSQRAARIKAVQEHFHIENTHDLDAVMDEAFETRRRLQEVLISWS